MNVKVKGKVYIGGGVPYITVVRPALMGYKVRKLEGS